MDMFTKYYAKLFLKQWSIGFSKGRIEDVIRDRKCDLNFKWIKIEDKSISHADPFAFKTNDGRLNILFENFSSHKLDGRISLFILDQTLNPVLNKVILSEDYHISYPYLFREADKIYVFPEAAKCGSLHCYEYDHRNQSLINKREIINLPILDATILKYENKYWLFGTMLGECPNSKLYIFYSDHLLGPYEQHRKNPVKNSLNGARPAGNFITVDGEIYRPAQNCRNYYGESISINKIRVLSETNFSEDEYMAIRPNRNWEYNLGIHTINSVEDIIIIDGIKGHFQPLKQFIRYCQT